MLQVDNNRIGSFQRNLFAVQRTGAVSDIISAPIAVCNENKYFLHSKKLAYRVRYIFQHLIDFKAPGNIFTKLFQGIGFYQFVLDENAVHKLFHPIIQQESQKGKENCRNQDVIIRVPPQNRTNNACQRDNYIRKEQNRDRHYHNIAASL